MIAVDGYCILAVVRSYAAYVDGLCWCCCKNVGT
ncbi:Uncharacterised protein [Segatella copri]|nr:Uncharacterised protein [Segatella copri]